MSNPAGWYPDPDGKPCERYWNGLRWTKKTRPFSKPKEKSKYEKILEEEKKLKEIKLKNMTEKERKQYLEKESAKNKKITALPIYR